MRIETRTYLPDQEVELRRVYDDKYKDYETEARVYTRLKNVKKKQNKGNR